MQLVTIPDIGSKPFYLIVDEVNDHVISRCILNNLVWDPVETTLLAKLLSPGDNVVDIGAHIGYYTVLFSQLVGAQGRVYGFEPEACNFSLLHANVLINGLDNVVIENQALSDDQREAYLYLSHYNKGDHRIAYTPGRERQTVASISLDQYLTDSSEKIHLIKSDTQGHELNVLKGMVKVIERNSDHLCCILEFSPGLLIAQEAEGVQKFIDFFDSFDAEIVWINEKGGHNELIIVDKSALHDIARTMLMHEDSDHSCNILVFFSTKARRKYFRKIGGST